MSMPPRQPVPSWDLHIYALPPLPPLLWLHLPSQHMHCQPKPFHPPAMLRQAGTSCTSNTTISLLLHTSVTCLSIWKPVLNPNFNQICNHCHPDDWHTSICFRFILIKVSITTKITYSNLIEIEFNQIFDHSQPDALCILLLFRIISI